MALSSSILFIDTALSCTSPYALSYPQPKQKWLIRKHLLSLIQDHPTLSPSTDKFTHNDGTTVNLLYTSGDLRVSTHTPPIPLTIWLHENYPYMPPLVFVSPNSTSPIHKDHPFVDLSGSTSVPYLQTWTFPRCNLTKLVHNLVRIFRHDHPLIIPNSSSPADSDFTHPSLVSKMEAIDRLAGMLHYDILALKAKIGEEVEELTELKGELRKRDAITRCLMIDLERERLGLKDRVMKLRDEGDLVMNWVKVNGLNLEEEGLEGEDEESKMVIECVAADRAIEDLMYEMEKGLEGEVMGFDEYIKQVRILGREQFIHRAMLLKLRGPHFLYSLHSCI
ncbi:protein ELC [Euphorbia lathyris]|uniref:protein ELC n=1 Tax=Euphorbia lathyris TaxID=212925 RepID=UPI0033134173